MCVLCIINLIICSRWSFRTNRSYQSSRSCPLIHVHKYGNCKFTRL